MKVISKSKDYYDYLMGIYGMDPKIVYERPITKGPYEDYEMDKDHYLHVYLCGSIIDGFYSTRYKSYYYGKAIEPFGSEDYKRNVEDSDKYVSIHGSRYNLYPVKDAHNLNAVHKQPIFIKKYVDQWDKDIFYPKLKDIGFHHYMDAKTIYLLLTDWLSPKDIVSPARPDKEKIVSHGFDLKTSFRNTK